MHLMHHRFGSTRVRGITFGPLDWHEVSEDLDYLGHFRSWEFSIYRSGHVTLMLGCSIIDDLGWRNVRVNILDVLFGTERRIARYVLDQGTRRVDGQRLEWEWIESHWQRPRWPRRRVNRMLAYTWFWTAHGRPLSTESSCVHAPTLAAGMTALEARLAIRRAVAF